MCKDWAWFRDKGRTCQSFTGDPRHHKGTKNQIHTQAFWSWVGFESGSTEVKDKEKPVNQPDL